MGSKIIKEAFSMPARELRAKVTIGGKVFTDEHLESIRAVTGLSESNDFEVGTAFMASATIKLVDKYENFKESNFKDKLAKVEIGVKTPHDFDYTSIGEFIVDSVGNNMKSWELKCYDLMHKFNVKYDCKLTFPTSLKSIVLDICSICGVEPSDNVKNSALLDRSIKFKPNFYDMTAREVLAQVAELVCAWAYIDVDSQKLDIGSYALDDEIKINDDNLISFKEYKNTSNSDCKILLDSVKIIQNGADDADYNPDSPRKFHIVDNMFIQGNGSEFVENAKGSFKFNELSALSIKYNGNPALRSCRCVQVVRAGKEYNFLPLVRKLTYNGGLVEECECKQINYDPANRRKEIVRHVEKINALLKVMDNKIQSKVGTEEFQTLVEQTKEEIKLLAKNINLEGYVKFEDLKKVNNSTIINGGNITTGVIQSKDGGFGIDLDNKTFFLGRDLEHYALLFDGENLKFGTGGIKSDQFSEGLKQELKGQDGQSQYVHTRYSDSGGDVGSMHVNAVDDSGEPYKYIGFAVTNSKGAPALKSEYKWSKYVGDDGESFKYNLISNGDFHIDFTKDEPGHNSKVLNRWQAKSRSDVEKMYIRKPSDRNWIALEVSATDTIEINQYLNLKKNTKYYIKATIASERMMLYYHGSSYNSIASVKDNYEHFTTINTSFTTEDSDTHYIQLDCKKKTRVRDVIISEEPISDNTEWYPSKFDGIGQDGKPGKDGRDGERGAQGPPGRDGKDGTTAEWPTWIKEWNGTSTWINGKSVVSPTAFFGESNKGIFMGKNCVRTSSGEELSGIVGYWKPDVTFHIKPDGTAVFGNKPGNQMKIDSSGNVSMPKVKTSEIIGDGKLYLSSDKSAYLAMNKESLGIAAPGGEINIFQEYISIGGPDLRFGGKIRKYRDSVYIDISENYIIVKSADGQQILSTDFNRIVGLPMCYFSPHVTYRDDDLIYYSGDGALVGDSMMVMCSAVRATKGGFVNLKCRNFSNVSDIKVKENVSFITKKDVVLREKSDFKPENLEDSDILNFVKNIRLATFNYTGEKQSCFSMIAQDVNLYKNVNKYLISQEEDSRYMSINQVNYHSFLHRTLQIYIEDFEKEKENNARLEERVRILETEISEIKKLLKKEGE